MPDPPDARRDAPPRPSDPSGSLAEHRDEATATAIAAAERADVTLAEVDDPAAGRELARLFDRVWGRPPDAGHLLGHEVITAIARAGGQVTTATRDGVVVAGTVAFLGRDADGTVHLHSHISGVLDEHAGGGIGAALKWHQRAWSLARSIGEVRWTFDPLIARNVGFNLVHLGAQVDGYRRDAYGQVDDARSGGVPTDRVLVRWDLTAPRVVAAAGGRQASPDVAALRRAGAATALDRDDDGGPRVTATDAPRRLLRVPADVEALRRDDPERARAWTTAVRTTLADPLDAGARVTGATRDGWLVLAVRAPGVTELAR